MSDDGRTTRQPVMDSLCVGGCGANITDADNFDPTGVHLKPGWLFTENSRGYIWVRCPTCGGELESDEREHDPWQWVSQSW